MVEYGITPDGFRRKTYMEILADLQTKARESFGDNINLSNTSFLGMWLQNEAWEIATMWELAESVYYSAFVDFSEGISLDGVSKYIAITRKEAQKSKGHITIKGDEGTKIHKGFRVADESMDIIFETTAAKEIDETGEVEIPVSSIGAGVNMNIPAHALTKIVNPIAGVNEVYNLNPTEEGTDVETDPELRERYYRSVSRGGSSTREAVEGTLLDMEEVVDAFVIENDTMTYIEDMPPKSIHCLVEGADDEDIAKTILSVKAGGIQAYGDIDVEIEDEKGMSHTIGFSRPVKKEVYVKLNISRGDGYIGDNVVKRAVINYIGGLDQDSIFYKGLKLGEDVIITRIMSGVMCLGGINDIEVSVSLDNSTWQSSNIKNAIREIAETGNDKVVINYVE